MPIVWKIRMNGSRLFLIAPLIDRESIARIVPDGNRAEIVGDDFFAQKMKLVYDFLKFDRGSQFFACAIKRLELDRLFLAVFCKPRHSDGLRNLNRKRRKRLLRIFSKIIRVL